MIFTQALIQEPMAVFAYLIAIVGIVFMLATVDYAPLKKFFGYLPPLIWMYFLPMLSTTFGIIPQSSDLYSFLSTYMLPAGLLLLMISTNVPATLKLGGKAGPRFPGRNTRRRHRRSGCFRPVPRCAS